MAETKLLDFTASAVTPTQLDIRVKNIGNEALTKALLIEIKLPINLVSDKIATAVELARQRNMDTGCTIKMASLADLVIGPRGWSAWAADEMTQTLAIIRIFSARDQNNQSVEPANFDAGAEFTLHIPLMAQEQPAHVEIPYGYRYPNERRGDSVEDKLEIATAGSRTRPPKVSLTTDQASPTTIAPGTEVKILWEVANGVSATLYGPLPGGNSQMSLSSDPIANYKISSGSLGIYAVGPATYSLHAEVRGADGQPNEIVIRTLSIDISSPKHYSYLKVRPDRVLPHGVVEVDWAVWGADQAFLYAGRDSLELRFTEQNLSGTYQGAGVWRVNAPADKGTEIASLKVRLSGKKDEDQRDPFMVEHWDELAHSCTGNLIGMAVSGPKMALLTSDGLFIAVVGKDDREKPLLPKFTRKSTDTPKVWLALAAFDDGFVVLQRTNDDGLRVSRYTQEGILKGAPIDLPDDVVRYVPGSEFDLATLGQRAYVVVLYTGGSGKTLRFAYSVRFDPSAEVRVEPKLVGLSHFRLMAFDNALYALRRNTGQMIRFDLDEKGELAPARRAASAVREDGESMIRQGLLVPIGRILLVLAPSSTPSVDSLDLSGAMHYNQKNAADDADSKITQDLVYNPQQDHWKPCGHGLEIEKGAVAAFRGGDSKRLWVVQPGRKMSTLPGAREDFFAPEYVEKFSAKVLPPLLNRKREITIINQTVDLGPVNDALRWADMDDISSDSLAELASPPVELPRAVRDKEGVLQCAQKTLTILYSDAYPGTVRLHFMDAKSASWASHALFEVTLSGPGLSNVSSVYKIIRENGRVDEFPHTRSDHPADGPVILPGQPGSQRK